MKIIHLLSGGLDSAVLLWELKSLTTDIRCVGFHYGQKHFRELDAAKRLADLAWVPFTLIELSKVFSKSALIDGHGGVVVPNRNLVFLSIGGALASADGYTHVSIACNRGDRDLFPDCRWEFVEAAEAALIAGAKVGIYAPYLARTKKEIVETGRKLGVPLEQTWSCYVGGQEPCGKCNACITRTEAMQ